MPRRGGGKSAGDDGRAAGAKRRRMGRSAADPAPHPARPAVGSLNPYACVKCGKQPPREAYRCLLCGKVPEKHPYPNIGCECIRACYLCDPLCIQLGKTAHPPVADLTPSKADLKIVRGEEP